tara:strand:- start:344 stop:778 length:435 start_codon:yes stop_codon:yes gene_type:complete
MATINSTITASSVKIRPGYNCYITIDSGTNSIIIGAGLGDGEGRHCDEIAYEPAAVTLSSSSSSSGAPAVSSSSATPSPPSTALLTGGPRCDELIYSLNGIKPDAARNVNIQGTRGITVVPVPAQNLIRVYFYLDSKLICGTLI